MLQNARVTAFTRSELLSQNQKGGGQLRIEEQEQSQVFLIIVLRKCFKNEPSPQYFNERLDCYILIFLPF